MSRVSSRKEAHKRTWANPFCFVLLFCFIYTHRSWAAASCSAVSLDSEMRATLFVLHAISCCCLVSATLSKSDAKKPHRAEAEVRNFRARTWRQVCCDKPLFTWRVAALARPVSAPVMLSGHSGVDTGRVICPVNKGSRVIFIYIYIYLEYWAFSLQPLKNSYFHFRVRFPPQKNYLKKNIFFLIFLTFIHKNLFSPPQNCLLCPQNL